MQSLWMIVASLLFASMGVCVKLGAGLFSIGEMVLYRGAIGLLIALFIGKALRIPLRTPAWRLQITRAIAGSLALLCYFYAISILPLATAVTLNYTSPIFVALLLLLRYGERLRWPVLASLLLGFAGVVLLLKPTLQADQWTGALAGLGSGLIASIAYVNVRELGRLGEPEVRTVFWFSGATVLLGLPWAAIEGFHAVNASTLPILLGVGIFGGAAQFAMTRAYRLGKTIVSANLAYTTVIFSSLFGVLLWGETLPLTAWVAIGLIVSGGVAVSLTTQGAAAPSQPPASLAPSRRGD